MHPLIDTHRREILNLAERCGVTDVRVFGSMARGDADGSSDVACGKRYQPKAQRCLPSTQWRDQCLT